MKTQLKDELDALLKRVEMLEESGKSTKQVLTENNEGSEREAMHQIDFDELSDKLSDTFQQFSGTMNRLPTLPTLGLFVFAFMLGKGCKS